MLQLDVDEAEQRTVAWLKPLAELDSATSDASPSESQPRVMKVRLWLRVENSSEFMRGKKKAREEIEDRVLRHYGLRATDARGPSTC